MDIFYDRMLIILWGRENINDVLISGNGSQQNASSATLTTSRKLQKYRKAIILLLLMRLQLDKLPLPKVQLSTFSWS